MYKRIRSEAILPLRLKSWEETTEVPQIPTVASSLPEDLKAAVPSAEGAVDLIAKKPDQVDGVSLFQGASSGSPKQLRKATLARASPRAFRLSRTPFSTGPPSPLLYGGVRKQKKARRTDFALFVENHLEVIQTPDSNDSNLPTVADADVMILETSNRPEPPTLSRKRPHVSEAEKKLLENYKAMLAKKELENKEKELVPQKEEELLKLASELNEFTLEELNATMKPTTSTTHETPASAPTGPANLKFQPKPPPPRRPQPASEDTAVQPTTEEMDTSPDNYVYDTYLRHTLPPSPKTATATASRDPDAVPIPIPFGQSAPYPSILDPARDGLLVIPAADQEVWDTYFEDPIGSDDEIEHSDDEDSNAEDYYTHDYPEDEFEEEGMRLGERSDDDEYEDVEVEEFLDDYGIDDG